MSKQPLYPHVPKSREPLYSHPSKAIAALPMFTGKAYRVDIPNWGIPKDATVAAMVRFEQEELGNVCDISPELMVELGKYYYSDATWVTKTKEDARNYLSKGMSDKDISEITYLSGGRIITENGMGGYLILQPNARPRQSQFEAGTVKWGNRAIEYGFGRCPKCGLKYDTTLMQVRNEKGFPICPMCRVPLRGVRR